MQGTEIQKFEYLENKKSILDEIKSIFHSFWRTIIWRKNKNSRHKLQNRKNPIFGPFPQFLKQKVFFRKTQALSCTTSYRFLAPCQNSEECNDPISRKHPDRQGRKTDRPYFIRSFKLPLWLTALIQAVFHASDYFWAQENQHQKN